MRTFSQLANALDFSLSFRIRIRIRITDVDFNAEVTGSPTSTYTTHGPRYVAEQGRGVSDPRQDTLGLYAVPLGDISLVGT